MERTAPVRVFRGSTTQQVCGDSGRPAAPEGWYWEPADYEGDTLWSPPYRTQFLAWHEAQYTMSSGQNAADIVAQGEVLGEPCTLLLTARALIGLFEAPEALDLAQWEAYWQGLCQWVAAETGAPLAGLLQAWHPEKVEPQLYYRLPVPEEN